MKLSQNKIPKIKLRKTIPEDLPLIYELYHNGQNNQTSRIMDHSPVSYEEFKKFYDDKTIVRYTIISENNNFLGHTFIKQDNKITCELILSNLNKGIGKFVLSELMKLEPRSFYVMGIRFGNNKAEEFAKENGFKEWYTVYKNI
jgi:hypothetical protein